MSSRVCLPIIRIILTIYYIFSRNSDKGILGENNQIEFHLKQRLNWLYSRDNERKWIESVFFRRSIQEWLWTIKLFHFFFNELFDWEFNIMLIFRFNISIQFAISAFQIKNKNNGPSFLKSFAFKSEFFQELWHVWQYFLLDWYPFMSFCGCLRHPMICTNWALWVVIKHCIYASKGDH